MRSMYGLMLTILVLLAAGCGSSSSSGCVLSGTMTLSGVTITQGQTVTFNLDDDPNVGNGVGTGKSMTLAWPGGAFASYIVDITNLAAGQYWHDVDVPLSAPPAESFGGPHVIACGSTLNIVLMPVQDN